MFDLLNLRDLLPRLQSAQRTHHFNETAVFKLLADSLLAATLVNCLVSGLALLDLSAAFETVDYDILLQSCRRRSV